jgi:hypothetical protein
MGRVVSSVPGDKVTIGGADWIVTNIRHAHNTATLRRNKGGHPDMSQPILVQPWPLEVDGDPLPPATPNPDAAIAWYRANRDRIAAALPLRIGPATYTPSFVACMDSWIALAPTLTPTLAECYICRPLRAIRAELSGHTPDIQSGH